MFARRSEALRWSFVLTKLTGMLAVAASSVSGADAVLPGTSRLVGLRPVDEVMVDGINRFCLRQLEASRAHRQVFWQRNAPANDKGYVDAARKRFRHLIGAVDPRVTSDLPDAGFELLATLDVPSVVARTEHVTVHAVRWPVLDGLTAEGLLLKPDRVRARVVALPDADWTPEMFCGISEGLPESTQFARQLGEAGCLVVIPVLLSRSDEFSGHPDVGYTNQPHREFLYRQAFEVGRHPIGFEVQKVLAAIDLFSQGSSPELPVGVAGVGEGGRTALYAAALDTRIDVTLISGYFQRREGVWQEPIDRNVWSLLTEFGDAELAGMIAPRRLIIEACAVTEFAGPPAVRPGRRNVAAPGTIATNSLDSVQTEYQRAAAHYRQQNADREISLAVSGESGSGAAGSQTALAGFADGLGIALDSKADNGQWDVVRVPAHPEREKRQFDESQEFVQTLLRRCHKVRSQLWTADRSSVEAWLPTRERLRIHVHEELIGRLRLAETVPNARTRLVIDHDDFLGYEVVLDVAPDIIAAGILLLPKDLSENEKRPVVVCQHGLEGRAMDTISREPRPYRSYKAFAEELCRRGFIVYAPQNPYRGRDRFRSIQRKANPLGLSLFSFITEQHRQTQRWLKTLLAVDGDRIAFYGLSYGGKTAMRVPPLLDGYCLSICSGDFTDWARTIASNEDSYSYVFTGEYEIPEWNLGHIANYAELAMLMSPRPFMVEAGHRDGGQPTELVFSEFGKVRHHYDTLKISDRARLEFFNGPHTIHGKGTFQFLHEHLDWPVDSRSR